MYSTQVQVATVRSLGLYVIVSSWAAEWYTHRFPSVD